jgi:hypothetical protein
MAGAVSRFASGPPIFARGHRDSDMIPADLPRRQTYREAEPQ